MARETKKRKQYKPKAGDINWSMSGAVTIRTKGRRKHGMIVFAA